MPRLGRRLLLLGIVAVVVFSKEKPDDELYWKTELEAAEKEVMKQEL